MYHVFYVLVLIHVYSVNNYLPEWEPMSLCVPLLQRSISGTAVLFTDYVSGGTYPIICTACPSLTFFICPHVLFLINSKLQRTMRF